MRIENKSIQEWIKQQFHKRQWREVLILALIFTGSLLIRWIGLKHGFPLLTHPDEQFSLDPVVRMTQNHTLNPGTFNRPQQVTYWIYFVFLNALSYLRFGSSLAQTYAKYILDFHYYARISIAVIGSSIPIVAYLIGKLFKPKFAVAAALVFALFPSYAVHSLYITPDVPITFLTLLVIYFTLRYLTLEDPKSIFIATFFAAVNTAEKYPGLISLGIVFLGIAFKILEKSEKSHREKWCSFIIDALKFAGVYIIALFIVAPFLFIKAQEVVQALLFESRSGHLGADNLGWLGNMWFYLQSYGSWTNWLSLLWIGLGIFAILKSKNKNALLLAYGALYWVLLSVLSLHWERWALPMYITPLFLTAIGINFAWNLGKKAPVSKYLSFVLIGIFFFYQFIYTLHIPVKMSFRDTRVESLAYCNQYGITKENTYFEGFTPLLPQGPKIIYDINIGEDPKYDYIILSSNMYDRYYAEPGRYLDQIRFYEEVRRENKLLAKFEPDPKPTDIFDRLEDIAYYIRKQLHMPVEEQYRGYIIEIYQIEQNPK